MRVRTALVGACFGALAIGPPAHATFPGENGKIAFQRNFIIPPVVFTTELFTMEPDGSAQTQLTFSTHQSNAVIEEYVAWSPDGKRIAFDAAPNGSAQYSIYVMNADGTGVTRLTGTGNRDLHPTWSPDGTKIAFARHVFGIDSEGDDYDVPADIYVMNSDGTGQTRLGGDPELDDLRPDWSPDGTKIAFDRRESYYGDYELYVMNSDGSGVTKVTDNSVNDVSPSWSSDGNKLAFQTNRDTNYEIYTMEPDGQNAIDLTRNPAFDSDPVWSPDGTKIAFATNRDGNDEIYVMTADGSDQANVTASPQDDELPDWQRLPNRPPECSGVAAYPSVLQPANRKLVPVTFDGATDPDGDSVSLSIDWVTQDEPVTSRRDRMSPDAIDGGGGEVRLRAERDPGGDGRVYEITFTASDGRGGSCPGSAKVGVPRKKREPAIDSAPPSYDSTG